MAIKGLSSKLSYLTMKDKIKGNKEAPICRGGCVSDSVTLLGVLSSKFLVSNRQITKKKKRSNTPIHFFSFFTYIKYIGKSAVALLPRLLC